MRFHGKIRVAVRKWSFHGFTYENRGFSEKWGFFRKMGFSWVFGQEIGENKGRAGNLMISGKSGKIGKSKESKRPALNVDKILNFGVGVGFF